MVSGRKPSKLHLCLRISCMPGTLGGQKKASESPELESEAVVSCHMVAGNGTQVLGSRRLGRDRGQSQDGSSPAVDPGAGLGPCSALESSLYLQKPKLKPGKSLPLGVEELGQLPLAEGSCGRPLRKSFRREMTGGAVNSALRRESQGSLNSSASLDLGFLAFVSSKSESHRKSLGSGEAESESRPGKYCCVYLPDGTASLALARPGLTIRDMLAGICEKRGLSLPDIKVYLVGNEQKALVLDQDCTVLADQEVRLENRITFQLELANLERVVRISAKPTKRLQEALQPILAKHGLSLEQVVLHRPGEKQLLDLEKLVSSVASQTLVLDIHPDAKMSEAGSTSPCRSQGCLPRTQDKDAHLPPLPSSLLVEEASSSTGKRQTCDIEGLVELLNRVQSSGAHDQRGLLRKEDLVLPEFLQLPSQRPGSQEAPP